MSHPWQPVSTCGAGCLPTRPARVSVPTTVVRAAVLVLMASSSVLWPATRLLRPGSRAAVQRVLARKVLRAIGIRLRVRRGQVGPVADGGVLVVAGHVSWLDVLVLAAVVPGRFVARADLIAWPVLGSVVQRAGVIPIERGSLRGLPATVTAVRDRLTAGETVIAFPEGTTWCGRSYGRFRPALFQAAVDARRPVLPVAVDYLGAAGERTTGPSFVGDEAIGTSLLRVLRSRGLRAEVRIGSMQPPGTCRRELARRCEQQIRGDSQRVTGSIPGRLTEFDDSTRTAAA